jgi:hypothetical protein
MDCSCGRTVEVPPLSALRAQAGESVVALELLLEAMLHDGELPEENACLRCSAATQAVALVRVDCEKAEIRRGDWNFDPSLLLFGWLRWTRSPEVTVIGRDLSYRLPLRLCPACSARIRRWALKKCLRRVPIYARLLEKYPRAKIQIERP